MEKKTAYYLQCHFLPTSRNYSSDEVYELQYFLLCYLQSLCLTVKEVYYTVSDAIGFCINNSSESKFFCKYFDIQKVEV